MVQADASATAAARRGSDLVEGAPERLARVLTWSESAQRADKPFEFAGEANQHDRRPLGEGGPSPHHFPLPGEAAEMPHDDRVGGEDLPDSLHAPIYLDRLADRRTGLG